MCRSIALISQLRVDPAVASRLRRKSKPESADSTLGFETLVEFPHDLDEAPASNDLPRETRAHHSSRLCEDHGENPARSGRWWSSGVIDRRQDLKATG